MKRLQDYIRAIKSDNLWYNFDTKEIITDEELRKRVTKKFIKLEQVSNRIDIPIFGSIDWTIKYWFTFMDFVASGKQPNPAHGKIRVRQHARGDFYPNAAKAPANFKAPGWTVIPAHSKGAKPWKELSPFFIGPVIFDENGVQKRAENFESFWQSFKIWRNVEKQSTTEWNWPAEVHVDANENPNASWQKWHDALLKNKMAVRRPNGRAVPLYAWWKGQKLGIIEARKQIYIPYLQDLYRQSPIYKQLLEMVRNGKNIIIIEPDGPKTDLYPTGMDVTRELLLDLVGVQRMKDFPGGENFPEPNKYVAYGHGYVIALTLLEDLEK